MGTDFTRYYTARKARFASHLWCTLNELLKTFIAGNPQLASTLRCCCFHQHVPTGAPVVVDDHFNKKLSQHLRIQLLSDRQQSSPTKGQIYSHLDCQLKSVCHCYLVATSSLLLYTFCLCRALLVSIANGCLVS